jgi:hypothetical protein
MLIPETVARFNAHVTNRVTDPDCRLVPDPFAWRWGCST